MVLSGSLVCFYGDDCSKGALHALFCVWEKFSGEVFSVVMFSMGRLSGFLYPDIFIWGLFDGIGVFCGLILSFAVWIRVILFACYLMGIIIFVVRFVCSCFYFAFCF